MDEKQFRHLVIWALLFMVEAMFSDQRPGRVDLVRELRRAMNE
jgi:hypothetical protein